MGWPFRRNKSVESSREEQPPWPRSEVHASPAFEALVGGLEEGASLRILDLGASIGPNIEFFSRYCRRLQIVDLFGSLAADESLLIRFQEHPEAVLDEVLPAPENGGFDILLVWDLFDYLNRSQLDALCDDLVRLSRPGARLLALVSTLPEISAEPLTFKIVDSGHLLYDPHTLGRRKCPRWAPSEIEHRMVGFDVDHSFLLRHGMREYLLARRAPC